MHTLKGLWWAVREWRHNRADVVEQIGVFGFCEWLRGHITAARMQRELLEALKRKEESHDNPNTKSGSP